ncbi:MAG: C45 family autoproteolytic acyltransferase/hydrolase [Promethearchaeota archaeon]
MRKSSRLKVLEFPIGTSPKERGRIRGETMRPFIIELIENMKYTLESPNLEFDDFFNRFVNDTKYLEAVRKWTPQLLEEVIGISEGSGIDFNTIFSISCVPELFQVYQEETQQQTSGCTTLGCFKEKDYPALLGQNLDLQERVKNNVVLLHLKEENGHESYNLTFPGTIGQLGLNNSPLGLVVNFIFLNSSRDGLPVPFIARKILEQSDLNDAIKFLKNVKHGAAQNYMLGDAEQIVDFECSANKKSQFIPYDGARRVYHTNHILANDDVIPNFTNPIKENSVDRFKYIEYRLKDQSKILTLENFKLILSSHIGPICQHGYGEIVRFGEQYGSLTPLPLSTSTCASVIYKLFTPPELYIALGNPCTNEYEHFTF